MAYRDDIIAKVEASKLAKVEEKSAKQCDHEWQKFRETIRNDNSKFHGSAHFVLVACAKCHEKRRTDVIVERVRAGDAA